VGTAHRIGFSFMVYGFSLKTENRIYHYLIIGGQCPPYIIYGGGHGGQPYH
jgi:hypothetical protein